MVSHAVSPAAADHNTVPPDIVLEIVDAVLEQLYVSIDAVFPRLTGKQKIDRIVAIQRAIRRARARQ